jgi:predicted metal-dependent hydrolase
MEHGNAVLSDGVDNHTRINGCTEAGDVHQICSINLSHVSIRRTEIMEVKVIRSPDRKETIQARMVEDTLVVHLPLGLHREEERKIIAEMKEKIEKKKQTSQLNKDDFLIKKFNEFNDKYFQGKLKVNSIKFVTNQKRVRGSCTPNKGTIRVSHKLLDMPEWVLDYVIMHEMTHLFYPNHSKEFWMKVGEYEYTERARGFLIAKGMEEAKTDGDEV